MNLLNIIAVARDQYQEYKRNGGRMIVPNNHVSHPNHIRMSALDSCSTHHAYSKLKIKPDFEISTNTKHLFEGGEYAAYMFQEALMYYAQTHTDFSFIPEYNIAHDKLGIAGRADGLIEYMEDLPFGGQFKEQVLLEIKYSEGTVKRSLPVPRLGHVLQCMAYMIGTNIYKSLLIVASKWSYDSAYYITTRSYEDFDSGFVVKHAKTNEEYDMGISLDINLLYEKINERAICMELLKRDGEIGPSIDIDDPRLKWQCFRVVEKGTKPKKDGTITRTDKLVANCEYAKRCRGANQQPFHLVYDSSENKFSLPQFE